MKVTLTFNEQRRAAYRQQGLWGDASLADYWQQTARAMPDKIAVVDNHGATYTYSALDHAASCLANWMLAKGIESGDRIAFQLPGWCEFTVIYLACLKTGAVSCRCYLPGGKQNWCGCSISVRQKCSLHRRCLNKRVR